MRHLFVLFGILGGVIPALGQQPARDPAPQSQTTVRDEVVVTATLGPEGARAVPVSADVIERDEIEARQVTAVADLLRTLPGLDVVRSGTAGKVTSLFTRGTESDHTLVLWNGVELNDPYFGGFDWGLLPTEGVERVEVIRGPYSALYGSDALGGVVQVFTGAGADNVLGLEAGEDGYARASVSAGVEMGAASYHVTARSRRSDGLADNDFYDSDELTARAAWRAGDATEVGLLVRSNRSELGIPFSGGNPTPERVTTWRETEVALPVTVEVGGWTIDGRVSRVSLDSELEDPDDPFGFTAAASSSTSERVRAVGSYASGADSQVAVGGEYERQEVDSGSVFGPDLQGARQTTRALFGQYFRAAGPWRFDLGLRHDDHAAFGARTTPRVGLSRRLGERSRLRAAYGEGFRSPSLGELYFPFSGNADLEPEESESVELAYEFDGAAWSASLTAFENTLSNLIDFDFVDFRNVNVGRARTRGAELGVERHWGAAGLRANATYLEATDRDSGLPLLRRPEWRGSLVAIRTAGDWQWTATAHYTGARDDVDPITFERRINPDYQRLDLALAFDGWRRLAPYARVENVTDEQYAEALGFAAPGRQFIGGVSLTF